MGTTVNGSRSWLMLGGMSIQPSEFAKLAVVLGMGLLVAERFEGSWRRRVGLGDVLGMLAIAGVPAVLILRQDRQSVVEGQGGSVRVDLGGGRIGKQQNK